MKKLSMPTAYFGLKLVADNINKSSDTTFSVVPGKRCLFWKNMRLLCSVLENQQKFSSL